MSPVLSVRDLRVGFRDRGETTVVVDGLSYDIGAGEMVGLVGESGSGKSVSALALLRLLPSNAEVSGSVRLADRDLLRLSEAELRRIRGNRAAMVFQNPMGHMNPSRTIADQIGEAAILHQGADAAAARKRALALLHQVGIPEAERRLDDYPHQFSGGMLQRVMIAMALVCSPQLLIADEPTTALDVTIQAQILDLLAGLRRQLGLGILFITHDLALMSRYADRVMVMYAGKIVESAPTATLFDDPCHPYTRGLLNSIPRLGHKNERLQGVDGAPPEPGRWPAGCRFAPRCPKARDDCRASQPPLAAEGVDRAYACYHPLRTGAAT